MTFTPLYGKCADLILGDEATGDNFQCQLRSAVLTPDTNIERIKTLCPTGQYSAVDDPEWNLDLGYLVGEDDEMAALADYLLENQGQKVPFWFAAECGGPGYSGTVTIVPGPYGVEQGSFSEQSVSLPVDGQPVPWAGTGGGS